MKCRWIRAAATGDHRLALLVARDMIDAINDRLDGAMVAASAEGRNHN
jgi:hypothetical protein